MDNSQSSSASTAATPEQLSLSSLTTEKLNIVLQVKCLLISALTKKKKKKTKS